MRSFLRCVQRDGFGLIPVVVAVLLLAGLSSCASAEPSAAAPASAAASQPSAELAIENILPSTVLVRLGDHETITQKDFEDFASGSYPSGYNRKMLALAQERLQELYAKDHPELVSDKDIDQLIEDAMKKTKKTREQVIEGIEKEGMTLDMFYRRNRVRLLRKALTLKGIQLAADPAYLKKMYSEDPTAFNGTKVTAQHVLVWIFPHDTPEEIVNKRQRIENIRKDLLSGQLTWEAAQDASRSGLGPLSRLGTIPRHPVDINEALSEAAFKTKPGETSAVVRSGAGFHFVQVLDRTEGDRPENNAATRAEMQSWLERKFNFDAALEAEKKYPVVGVRPPARTPIMAQREFQKTPMYFGTKTPAAKPPATKPAGPAGKK